MTEHDVDVLFRRALTLNADHLEFLKKLHAALARLDLLPAQAEYYEQRKAIHHVVFHLM